MTRRLHGWGRPFLVACVATVVLRTVATCIALVTVYGVSFPHVVARTPHVLVGVFNRWDTGYYSLIAAHGYPVAQRSGLPPAIAFGPLYPAVVRSAQAVTGIGFLLAGQLVSMLALVVALAGLVHIAELDGDRVRSGTAVTLLVAFRPPSSWSSIMPTPWPWLSWCGRSWRSVTGTGRSPASAVRGRS